MTDIKAEALDWLRSYRNFPQLHSVNKAGFPIGRTTWFPIEDDWSIHATGYRGNYRVKQIRNNVLMSFDGMRGGMDCRIDLPAMHAGILAPDCCAKATGSGASMIFLLPFSLIDGLICPGKLTELLRFVPAGSPLSRAV